MDTLHRCQRFLKQNGIRYAHSVHPPAYKACDVAAAERMPVHDLAKVVVYSGDNGYGMLVLPADYAANLEEVRRLLGLSAIRLASECELIEVFGGCDVGSMPPFGNFYGIPVLLDEAVMKQVSLVFTAGTHRDILRMSVADFLKLIHPLVASFSVQAPELAMAGPV